MSRVKSLVMPAGLTHQISLHQQHIPCQLLSDPRQNNTMDEPVTEPPRRYMYPHDPYTLTRYNAFPPGLSTGVVPLDVLTFAVSSNHPIVARWDDVSTYTIEQLDRLNIPWVAVECFQRRQEEEESEDRDDTTVIITVQEFPKETNEIEKLLQTVHEYSGGLFVEMSIGQIRCDAPEIKPESEAAKGREQRPPYASKPPMGGSVGVAGIDWSTGTFGGYLELLKHGQPAKICGLTCHHVVAKSDVPVRNFEAIAGDAGKQIKIQHPSLGDHNRTLSSLESAIDMYTGYQSVYKHDCDPDPRTKTKIDKLNQKMDLCIAAKSQATSADREIGSVLASSGLRVSADECRLDWALIDLYPERIGMNKALSAEQLYGPLSKNVYDWCQPTENQPVYMIGRTSGLKVGYINGVHSCVCYRDTAQEMRTKEWAVASKEGGQFSQGGDSGALVIALGTDSVIGLVWGGNNDGLLRREPSYFTPLSVVAKSICEETGYSVRLLGGVTEIA
ncbi:hypothetical protein MferCBS31731_004195 [Microsporum ferrugineum]